VEVTVQKAIAELARHVKSNPEDDVARARLFEALREDGHGRALSTMLAWWSDAAQGQATPPRLMADLYYLMASRSEGEQARALCRSALELCPGHANALELLETLSGPDARDELVEHYLSFLKEVPFHAIAARIRVSLIDWLLEDGRYEEALKHVEGLPPRWSLVSVGQDVEKACRIARDASQPIPTSTSAEIPTHEQPGPLADASPSSLATAGLESLAHARLVEAPSDDDDPDEVTQVIDEHDIDVVSELPPRRAVG
jgi:tetratricopeptide (TPR) repeat protein